VETTGLVKQLTTSTSRRTVMKTGAKLCYAVPMVAASFALNARGALAVTCRSDFVLIEGTDPDQCCKCDQILVDPPAAPVLLADGSIVCIDPFDGSTAPATCGGVGQVSPV
jgi:hypothetical protein